MFRRITLQISEYSMLSVDVSFLFICSLHFSLSCGGTCWQLVGFGSSFCICRLAEVAASLIIFAVASYLESRSSGGIDVSTANLFWICESWLGSFSPNLCCNLLLYCSLFRLGDHILALLQTWGSILAFPHHAMITTRVETVNNWNIKEDVWPIRHDVVNLLHCPHLERSMHAPSVQSSSW